MSQPTVANVRKAVAKAATSAQAIQAATQSAADAVAEGRDTERAAVGQNVPERPSVAS